MSTEETKTVATEAPAATPAADAAPPAPEKPTVESEAVAPTATDAPAAEATPAPAAEPTAEKTATETPVETKPEAVVPSTEAPVAEKPAEVPAATPVAPEPQTAAAAAATESPAAQLAAVAAPVTQPAATPEAVAPTTKAEDTKAVPATAAPVAPTTTTNASAVPASSPLAVLWTAAQATGHPEIWGVVLQDPATHVPSQIVLQKYLNANDGDMAKAKDQLVKTLEWRAKKQPLELVKKAYSKAKFTGLGYVTSYVEGDSEGPEGKEVFTWNIYGAARSIDATFGNLEEFIEWRVALMELALAELSLSTATQPITADHDPYKIFQVHDYKSISFLRQPAASKTASTETIKVFAQNYPELLKEKFFVNVPAIMGFMYTFIKLFVAAKTIKKFHPMSNGGNLAGEFGAANTKFKALGEKLPKEYGGKGKSLEAQGKGPVLEEVAAEPEAEVTKA